MDILLLGLLLCAVISARFTGKSFHTGYIDKEQTTDINGIFVALVFIRHFFGSERPSVPLSFLATRLNAILLQFLVVTFLFYSGYGVMTSIVRKGADYVRRMPYYRIFRLWYHFALAILLYLCRNAFIGETHSLTQNLVAFTAWDTIGNSCWYIFAILFLYIATYLTYLLAQRVEGKICLRGRTFSVNELTVLLMFGAVLLYMAVLLALHKEKEYFNTVMFYPLGMLYCLGKKHINRRIFSENSGNRFYLTLLAGTLGAYLLTHLIVTGLWVVTGNYNQSLCVMLAGIPFMALIVLASMKISLHSKVLHFLGTYVFEIYILQRIPIKLCKLWLPNHLFLAFWLSAAATLGLALLFRRLTNLLDARLGMIAPPQRTSAKKG